VGRKKESICFLSVSTLRLQMLGILSYGRLRLFGRFEVYIELSRVVVLTIGIGSLPCRYS